MHFIASDHYDLPGNVDDIEDAIDGVITVWGWPSITEALRKACKDKYVIQHEGDMVIYKPFR